MAPAAPPGRRRCPLRAGECNGSAAIAILPEFAFLSTKMSSGRTGHSCACSQHLRLPGGAAGAMDGVRIRTCARIFTHMHASATHFRGAAYTVNGMHYEENDRGGWQLSGTQTDGGVVYTVRLGSHTPAHIL